MASEFWLTAKDLRILLLGQTGTGKTKLARAILRDQAVSGANDECVVHKDIQSERKICLVNTPGWDKDSIDSTSPKIRNEIARSVTLCPPGPHALVLVVPVSLGDPPPAKELKSAVQHMELLSARAWNYTMVVFLCDQDVDQPTVQKHIENAGKLLEKCRNRHHVLRSSEESETQIRDLLKKIDEVVVNESDYFLPQVYYELMQNITHERNEQPTQGGKEITEGNPRCRRQSNSNPPTTMTQDEQLKNYLKEVVQKVIREEALSTARYIFKPAVVMGLAIVGALIGSVIGSEYGVGGSGLGIIVGLLVTIPGSLKLIDVLNLMH